MSVTGKRFIVTGCATGMGRTTVSALVQGGADVVGFYRNRGIEDVERDIEGMAGKARFIRCDVADEDQVKNATAEAVRWLGGLDGLIHAAAIAPTVPAEEISLAQLNDVLRINMGGTMLTNQAVFPHLKHQGGRILNFASSTGATGAAMKADYAASKGAVLAWSRSIAAAWARYNITVNTICPVIMTDLYRATRSTMSATDLAVHDEQVARAIPLGGAFGDPDRDFAPFIVFYAGDGARFVTGQTLSVDGGAFMVR